MKSEKNMYIEQLRTNDAQTREYYQKSIVKTEQQKYLEKILDETGYTFFRAADICCGGGTLSFHLGEKFPDASFDMVDANPDAMELAKDICPGDRFRFFVDDVYDLKNIEKEGYDAIFCWQSLSWLSKPQQALCGLLDKVKEGGKIYISALFNLDHDVDIYARIFDHTRSTGNEDQYLEYNTISALTIKKWLDGKVAGYEFYKFEPSIDFFYDGRGLGTYTIGDDNGRMQISGGLLMNWAILVITK